VTARCTQERSSAARWTLQRHSPEGTTRHVVHPLWSIGSRFWVPKCSSSSISSSIVQCGRRRSSMSNPWWRCNICT